LPIRNKPLAKVLFAAESTEKKKRLKRFPSKVSVYSVADYARGQITFAASFADFRGFQNFARTAAKVLAFPLKTVEPKSAMMY
jgi:hypothetical protein